MQVTKKSLFKRRNNHKQSSNIKRKAPTNKMRAAQHEYKNTQWYTISHVTQLKPFFPFPVVNITTFLGQFWK